MPSLPCRHLAITLVVLAMVALITWRGLVGYLTPERDTIHHVARAMPYDAALEVTARANESIDLATDLSDRPGSDWPNFLGATHDGKSPETGVMPWHGDGPKVLWTVDVGDGYAAPAVCRGRVLVFDRVKSEARCRCLRASTGAELWRFTYATEYQDRQGYDGGPRAAPVTDGCRVYLHGADGMVHCLRLDNGKLLWKVDTFAAFGVVQNLFGAASSPLIDGDRLILQIGGSPDGTDDRNFLAIPSNGSCIVALDKHLGKVLYQCGNDLASYASPQIVTINGKKTGLAFARGGILGFDPERGVELFHQPFRCRSYNAVNASNLVMQDDRLFVTESYEIGSALFALRDNQLHAIWSAVPRQRDAGLCCHWNTPILVNGFLYGCASRHRGDAELRCIEMASGKVQWIHRPLLNEEPAGRSTLAYADGHLFYFSEEGWLFFLKANPERYEQAAVWDGHVPMPDRGGKDCYLTYPCWSAPVLAHGMAYLRGKGRMVCLEVMAP